MCKQDGESAIVASLAGPNSNSKERSRGRLCRIGAMALLALVAGVLFSGVAGCEESRAPVQKHTILVVGASQNDPLWPVLQGGARAFAKTVSGLTLTMLAPPTSSPQAQADLIQQNLNPSVVGICLQPASADAMPKLLDELVGRGISVVLIGHDFPGSRRSAYVGLDDQEAGKYLAEALRLTMHDRTTFMVLHAGDTKGPLAQRLRGFGMGMSEIGYLHRLREVDCQRDLTKAQQALVEEGRKYPELGMWVSIGDWPVHMPAEQLHKALGDQTGLVLIGAMPAVWPLMQQGMVRAAVGTNYGWWGYEAVNLVELFYHHAQVPDRVRLTDPCIVRPADLAQFQQEWQGWTQGHVQRTAPSTRPFAGMP